MDEAGPPQQLCMAQQCSGGLVACGRYCVEDQLLQASGFSSDSQCNTVFGRLAEAWPVPECGE